MQKRLFHALAGAAMLCSLGATGCGGRPARLQGVVTWNGKPVDGGMISFEPLDKPEGQLGTTIENDGSFRIAIPSTLAQGEFKVRIQAARKGKRKVRGAAIDGGNVETIEYEQSPVHYWEQSQIVVHLAPGASESLSFDVRGAPEKRKY